MKSGESRLPDQSSHWCSIVIPAHNEAMSIVQTLQGILPVLEVSGSQITVVCNGCTDDTAAQARSVDPGVCVGELPVGSKPIALNEGDRLSSGFPRIYMDADVRIKSKDVIKLATHMRQTGVPAAAPKAKMDFNGASWCVRAYYKVWFSLPYVQSGMVGCGVYVLSEDGRARFDQFPRVISDDGFVRAHFTDEERPVVEDCFVTVHAPRTLVGLIKIKTRSRLGGRQLRALYPDLVNRELSNPKWCTFLRLLIQPQLWVSMPCYMFVVIASILRSRRQFVRHQFDLWERDESSRSTTVVSSPN